MTKILMALGLFIISGCGEDPSPGSHPLASPPTFKIEDNWKAASKRCGDTALAIEAQEAYKLDKNYFGVIKPEGDCRSLYLYSRAITSAEWDGSRYLETASLLAGAGKKVCGTVEEVFEFTSPEMTFALKATAKDAAIEIKGAQECPAATLFLVLSKQ